MKKSYIFAVSIFTLLASSAIAEEVLWGYKKTEQNQTKAPEKEYVKSLDMTAKKETAQPQETVLKKKITPDFISVPVPKVALRKGTIITQDHLDFAELPPHQMSENFVADPIQIIGQQARRTLYKERPIRLEDTGPVIVVKRNQDVDLVFQKHGIILKTYGRALSDGGVGERIKVMNTTSKQIVFGKITDSGVVDVSL